MSNNNSLREANRAKNDEFYTQLDDIEKELSHYKEHFKNKVVFCNCDDPYESNFFKYFALNFNHLGLKKLICTCYAGSTIVTSQLSLFDVKGLKIKEGYEKSPYKIEITEVDDANGDGAIDISDVEYLLKNKENTLTLLKGDGDFRSDECIELLKESDIVVTNPPFSLFREYIAQLMEYNKKFLIIGNQNAMGYREIFPLFRDNKIWLGVSMNGSNRYFRVPDSYELTESTGKIENGLKYAFVKGVRWFTNLSNNIRTEKILLYKHYKPELYRKYENYDAINVDNVNDIPCDYFGNIGVPITFFGKYNPNQFKVIGLGISNSGLEIGVKPYKPEHKKYRKEVQKRGAVDGDLYFLDENGHPEVPFTRVIIQRIDGDDKNGNTTT
ncbi:MAG: adenine-specific methyltransferase EcoRI family protein [Bacilli bacterium]|nr:adenine-specific methyltransferase EcoRI family protein [Bacilli bacterium]